MTHVAKVEAYTALMASRGVGASTAAPPLWRLLWSLGIELPPPPFMGTAALCVLTGGLFGALMGLFLALAGLRRHPLSITELLVTAGIAGLSFGIFMAAYYRHLARRHGLGAWSAFGPGR